VSKPHFIINATKDTVFPSFCGTKRKHSFNHASTTRSCVKSRAGCNRRYIVAWLPESGFIKDQNKTTINYFQVLTPNFYQKTRK